MDLAGGDEQPDAKPALCFVQRLHQRTTVHNRDHRPDNDRG